MKCQNFQLVIALILALIGFNANVDAQDSAYKISVFFTENLANTQQGYTEEQIIERLVTAISAGSTVYQQNSLEIQPELGFLGELGPGLYNTYQSLDYVRIALMTTGNIEPGFEIVNDMRVPSKSTQNITVVPNGYTTNQGATPKEYSENNLNPNINSNNDLKKNNVILTIDNFTTIWDQDSTVAIFNLWHGLICHNDGWEDHDQSNCNLHNTSAGGLCFTINPDKIDQVEQRAQWRCNAYEEIYLSGLPQQVSFNEGDSETVIFSTNGTTVNTNTTNGLSAIVNGTEINISGNQSGFVEVISTDGTVDTVTVVIEVVVTALQPPTAICQSGLVLELNADGEAVLTSSTLDGGSNDPDGPIASMLVNGEQQIVFNCSQSGTQSVTLEVTDNDGLSSSCSTTIEVVDDTPPSLECVGDFTVQVTQGEDTTFTVDDFILSANDNCAVSSSSASQLNFSDMGTFPVTVTATDPSGNETTCTITVTVEMTTAVVDIDRDERISIFPNPASDWVRVEMDGSLDVTEVVLRDLAGREIKIKRVTASQFNIEEVPKGFFLVEITTETDIFVKKMLKL